MTAAYPNTSALHRPETPAGFSPGSTVHPAARRLRAPSARRALTCAGAVLSLIVAVAHPLRGDRLPRFPEGFAITEGAGVEPHTHTGWAAELVHPPSGIEFVFVPAGTFRMGSPSDEEGRENGKVYGNYALTGRFDEGPQHTVTISNAFYMATHELTEGQWERVMGEAPTRAGGNDRLPVRSATQDDCRSFLAALNGMGPAGFRLPTEAEWEYACRAGTTGPFTFGGALPSDQANFNATFAYGNGPTGIYRAAVIPVGTFDPNAWGLHDMHGNVWERCATQYGLYPTNGPHRQVEGMNVLRGGAWYCRPALCRSANRYREPSFHAGAGIRIVFEP